GDVAAHGSNGGSRHEDLLKWSARRGSTRSRGSGLAAIETGETLRWLPGRVEADEQPVARGGADQAALLPAARAGPGADGGKGQAAGGAQAPHEGDVLHQRLVREAARARVGLAAGEDRLVAVGQREPADARAHHGLDDTVARARGIDGQAEGADGERRAQRGTRSRAYRLGATVWVQSGH